MTLAARYFFSLIEFACPARIVHGDEAETVTGHETVGGGPWRGCRKFDT